MQERTGFANGLSFSRLYTTPGTDPLDQVEWTRRSSKISDRDGSVVFELHGIEAPASWSQLAVDIAASKYFRKAGVNGGGETSVRQLVSRIAKTIRQSGEQQGGYFATTEDAQAFEDELTYLLVTQRGAFNSPVWFNVGLYHQYGITGAGQNYAWKEGWEGGEGRVERIENAYERPPSSACFIQSVDDSLEGIMRLLTNEVMLFKYGSGTGSNFSNLRGEKEFLSGGGRSSGLMSFLEVYDKAAGAIKSGGTCLAPYQRVYTERGPVPVKELADAGGEFVAVSYDPPAKRYKAKRARAWLAGHKNVVRVVTDKGQFDVTDDHPLRLSTGEYVKAGELRGGMSLFACSIDESHGRVRVHLRDGKKGKEFLHRMIAGDVLGHNIDGMSVHHKDENPLNNDPSNLEVIHQSEHARHHNLNVVEKQDHVFQKRRFPKRGSANPMSAGSEFWKDEKRSSKYKRTQGDILKKSGRAVGMQKEAATQKMINTAYRVLNAGYPIDTFEQYIDGRRAISRIESPKVLKKMIDERFGSYDAFRAAVAASNHRVVRVETIGMMDVYDVEVHCPTPDDKSPTTGHNFVIWPSDERFGSGIVVANTRRAAKMVCLDMDHPDIEKFITWKVREEKKAKALIAAGWPADFNGEAYTTVSGQNANNSVRVTDEFMRAVEEGGEWKTTFRTTGETAGTYQARDLWRLIAQCAWECADPGVQYDTTINRWHTVPNSGRINASNPCCFVGDMLVDTSEGLISFDKLEQMSRNGEPLPLAFSFDRQMRLPVLRPIRKVWVAGETTDIVEVRTVRGITLRCTPDHRFLLRNGTYVEATSLKPGDRLRKIARGLNSGRSARRIIHHRILPNRRNGCELQSRFVWEQVHGPIPEGYHVHHKNEDPTDDRLSNLELIAGADHWSQHATGDANPRFIDADPTVLIEVWDDIATQIEAEKERHKKTYERMRQLHDAGLSFSRIAAQLDEEQFTPERAESWTASTVHHVIRQGYMGHQNTSVSVALWNKYIDDNDLDGVIPRANSQRGIRGLSWVEFERWVNENRNLVNDQVAEVVSIKLDKPAKVYDLEVVGTHNFGITNSATNSLHTIVVSNSEYMHLDDTACNLASLNLTLFLRPDHTFDVHAFRHAVRVFFVAQEILVDLASYPTPSIARNSHDFRPLGIGYANLGTLLMLQGFPYDSDEGRAMAGAITAILTGHAYRVSAEMAASKGAFAGYAKNREPMLDVMRMHRDAAKALPTMVHDYLWVAAVEDWEGVVEEGERNGFRNAQASVLAPTGTIGLLMDCDTTGVEPDFSLVKFKKLAGGGYLKIVNNAVPAALRALGYTQRQVDAILVYVGGTKTMDGDTRINRRALMRAGLEEGEVGKVEQALYSAFDLESCFAPHVIGTEAYERLGIPTDQKLLRALGFTESDIEQSAEVILGRQTVEGAPFLHPSHLPVFDCANRCGPHGTRFIEPMAHLRMMAAAQPFLSGAISKTVNVPGDATVEDIAALYEAGWKLGLKAVAIYRDGSKGSQPLSSGGKKKGEKTATETSDVTQAKAEETLEIEPTTKLADLLSSTLPPAPPISPIPAHRLRLPSRRFGPIQEAIVGNHKIFVRVGEYADGKPGEIFIDMHKEGAPYRALINNFAIAVSMGLQYGVPIEAFVDQFTFTRFEPQGIVQLDPHVKMSTSILDYVFRFIGINYCGRDDLAHVKPEMLGEAPAPRAQDDGAAPRAVGTVDIATMAREFVKMGEAAGKGKEGIEKLGALDAQLDEMMGDAPVCDQCGHITVRNGACFRCLVCGTSMGCS